MNENQNDAIDAAECQTAQALEELGGRVEAPERLAEILARVARPAGQAMPVPPETTGNSWAGKFWVAALVLLGVGTTITAALLHEDDDGRSKSDQHVHAPNDSSGGGSGGSPIAIQPEQVAKAGTENGSQQLPQGTDPADLAAMRSAEQMLAAEKKLQAMIADGEIAGVDQVLPFEQINAWPYTDGLTGMPDEVRQLDGKKVLMLGFMLPIDEVQNIREFLLVESLWSCCYGEPPNIHGLVRCTMPKDQRIDYQFEPLKIVGTLRVKPTDDDGYVVDIYQLEVDYVEVVH